jgi:hypothetical protein
LKPVLIWKQPPWTHTCPAPQQLPLQRTAHAPPQQPWPAAQAFPQTPQLAGSVWGSEHSPLQQFWPPGQFPQVSVPPQPSLIVPHWPGWQVGCGVQQLPSKQIWSRSQVLSQMPQFSGSFWRSVHSSPQQTRPSRQHSSIQQVWLFGQQVSPQQEFPAGQHTSPQQVWLLGQHSTLPQQTSLPVHVAPLCPQGTPLHWPLCTLQVWPVGQVTHSTPPRPHA